MVRGIKGFFAKPTPQDRRKAKAAAIKTQLKDWQGHWHDLFDQDPELIAAGEFERPDPLPKDIDGDFRLIFGLSRATRHTRKKCFALLPQGSEMEQRFDAFLTSEPVQLSIADAKAGVQKVQTLFDGAGLVERVDFSKIRIVDRSTEEGLASLANTDDIAVLLDKNAPQDVSLTTARIFLTEPLYASAGNYYHVRDWVVAAMQGGFEDHLQTELYHLWRGGWQVHFDDNGIVLAHRAR